MARRIGGRAGGGGSGRRSLLVLVLLAGLCLLPLPATADDAPIAAEDGDAIDQCAVHALVAVGQPCHLDLTGEAEGVQQFTCECTSTEQDGFHGHASQTGCLSFHSLSSNFHR